MGRGAFAAILGSWTTTVSLPRSCERGTEFFFANGHPVGVGIQMSGTSRAVTSSLARVRPTHSGESSARNSPSILGMSTESPSFDPHHGLDLTVWVCSSWSGAVQNCEAKEHDAIGWIGVDELGGLEFADPSYLSMLRRVLGTA